MNNAVKTAKREFNIRAFFEKLMSKSVLDKIFVTLFILFVYRLGCNLSIPFVNAEAMQAMFGQTSVLDYYNLVSGGALAQCAVFALGVSAYISASIIIQLLCVAIPRLEELTKDVSGKKKINKITQYVGCGLGAVTAFGYFLAMVRYGAMKYTSGFPFFVQAVTVIAILTAGAQIVIWLGWKIDEKGIGNGISLIIFSGIISRWDSVISLITTIVQRGQESGWWNYLMIPAAILFVVAATWYVVHTNNAERRIAVQYSSKSGAANSFAKRASYIPLKLIMSGVMPIIFASTICSFPSLITMFIDFNKRPSLFLVLASWNSSNWLYVLTYIVLIFCFNRFYISITFDPDSMSNNLRMSGGSIPGIRPGKPTAQYLDRNCKALATSGSFVLSVVACLPIVAGLVTGLDIQFGGTSLLIIVGVALDVVHAIDSDLAVHHRKGFLD